MLYAQLESRVQTCLDELVKSGKAVGLQAAVVHRGELVAEAWSGIADTRTERPVDRDILFPVFSMTKGVAATLVHLVAGAGRLNYDAPLADYWPEFGCRGKEKITMRMVLSHTAGVPQLPEAESHEEFADFERMAAAVAALEPLWKPGTECHYHAVTFSWLAFKPLKNITGCSFNELVRRYLGKDCYCGMTLREAETLPIAWLEPNPSPPALSDTVPLTENDRIARLAIPPQVCPLEQWMNNTTIRTACIPASTGIMNARFIAGMYGDLVHGKLIAADQLTYAVSPVHQPLVPPGKRGNFGLGYALDATPGGSIGRVFGHGGYGGSNAKADLVGDFAVAVLKNRMDSCDVFTPVWQLVREALA